MSVTQRLIGYHMGRLKDKNPAVRIKSIEELALLEAVDALETLEHVFRTDPDPEVRQAAQAAGRALFGIKQRSRDGSTP
jgi:hypothetical protein